ncbi:MAG: DNA repair protein RadA [Spirochaetales bacterium]|nr:DNA repair protein RadA [Spirochaetales bacterium]
MAKKKIFFECSSCGHQEPKWTGRCPQCGEWNTFTEGIPQTTPKSASRKHPGTTPLSSLKAGAGTRFTSGIGEFNRVLGGGIMKGAAILVGGEPGIGKSTLMIQAADSFPPPGKVLYISGEEAPEQIKMRADRLGITRDIEILCEPELESILSALRSVKPSMVIIDSIQTLLSPEAGSVPGTPNQLKYCCHELITWARSAGSSLFFVAHITKDGSIAGPKVIEHMVDTVLYFDNSQSDVRFLRSTKNRFGSVDEIGLFTMTEKGLEEVTDPSSLFLVERADEIPPGIATVPVYEGSRVLMVEIQALVVPAKGGLSRTYSDRVDPRRVSRIAAVLEKHLSLRFSDQDLYINVAGGMNLKETGIDLGVALALYSARTGISVSADTAVTGELSLAGEIRPIPHLDKRIKAAGEMGFSKIIGPSPSKRSGKSEKPGDYRKASSLKEAISQVFGKTGK